jgi:hypothetical protein
VPRSRFFLKAGVFLICLTPLTLLLTAGVMGNLSANPIKDITEDTGVWTLRFLLLTLCVTPLRKLSGWNEVIRFRRMLGLFAFFYGFLHLMTYLWLDQFFSLPSILHDVVKRPFIAAGTAGFLMMAPLGGHIHKKVDRPTWWQAMAVVAPPGLSKRRSRRRALSVAREGGHSAACDIRGSSVHSVGLPFAVGDVGSTRIANNASRHDTILSAFL